MKILVIGDCHGSQPEIPEKDFDLVLAVGDICGGTDEMRNAMFEAINTDQEWQQIFGEEKAQEAVEDSIQEGKEILSKLNSLGKPVYIVPGNWDWTGENSDWQFLNRKGYPEMLQDFENIHNLNFSQKEYLGVKFVGYGPCSGPEIPQYEDDKPESESEMEDLRRQYKEKKGRIQELFEPSEETIFLSHNVPNDTELDRIDNPDSPKDGRHYGSIIVRELIEENAPKFNIAGHMHEGKGSAQIEDTKCINTGLHELLIVDTDSGKVEWV